MNEDLRIRITAQNDAKPALDQLNTSLKQTSTQANVASRAMGGFGRNAGQAGIQVQQFVGQVQGGVNPLVAFSQQATDLGFVLGFPLLGAVTGIASAIAVSLIPAFFSGASAAAELADKIDELNESTATMTAAQREIKAALLGEQLEEQNEIIDDAKKAIDSYRETLNFYSSELSDYEKEVANFAEEEERINKLITEQQAIIDTATQKIQKLKDGVKDTTVETDKQAESLENLIKSMQTQAETLGMTNTQLAVYRARQLGASDADIERLQTLGMTIEEYERQQEKEKEIAAWKAQYDKDRKQANADMLKEQERITAETLRQLKPIEDSFVNLINGSKSVADSFRAMARSIVDDLIRIEVQRSITGPLSNIIGGMGGFGGIMSGLFGGGGATSWGVDMNSFSYSGGGYTGSGSRSGGVDGQGGFPAILHPNETVIDHTKGQSAGGVVVNQTINVSTGVQQTVRTEIAQLLPQIAEASKAAVLDARKRGGSYSAAFGG